MTSPELVTADAMPPWAQLQEPRFTDGERNHCSENSFAQVSNGADRILTPVVSQHLKRV